MKKNLLFVSLGFSLLFLLTNCKKGDPGPAGATGPAGPTGAAGPVGTANIIYSPWANLTFTGSGTSWSAQIAAPGVTQDIMDKGVVKTYFKFGTAVYDGNYSNIPTGAGVYQYLSVGLINLRATFAANYPWRYVIIPGGVAGGRLSNGSTGANTFVFADGSTMLKSELDKMSYEDVCSRFNIPRE
jgi:hypothetical protein